MSTDFLSDLVSQAEAARIRGVSRQAISKLLKEGKLTAHRVAGRILVSREEVETYQIKPAGRPKNGRNDC